MFLINCLKRTHKKVPAQVLNVMFMTFKPVAKYLHSQEAAASDTKTYGA